MNQLGFPLLSIVLWLPALGALALMLIPRDQERTQRQLALVVALVTLLASLPLYLRFDFSTPAFQFVDSVAWVPSWGIFYRVSVDGISLWMVLLATFLTPIALLASWDSIGRNFRAFQALILVLESGMIGVFVAQDMFLFYIFFELTLIPTALLIGIWGGENRVRAAAKFFLYAFAGSVFLLLGIIGLYVVHGQETGTYTFDIAAILASIHGGTGEPLLDTNIERLLFGAFFIGFAVKTPLWPFHTWLPASHTEAPASGAVDLAGMMLKLGAYGLIRFNLQMFPQASQWAAPAIGVLAVIGILYGAMVAYAQTDMKRLIAFSSVSHLGFIVLGIFALNQQGISGALLQMVNHGLSTAALFLVAGMVYARRGTRELPELGGLWKTTPVLGGLTLVAVLASVGLPGLNGFIGEFAIMQGAWLSPFLGWGFILPAVLGVVLAATYLLRMYRMAFMGDANQENSGLPDLNRREIIMLAALLIPCLVIGLYPNLLFAPMQQSVAQVVQGLAGALAMR